MRPGYQASSESQWWWNVAQHLDSALLALTNAMAHNVDDPRPIQALHERLRAGQVILLEIFRSKGLLPAAAAAAPATTSEQPFVMPVADPGGAASDAGAPAPDQAPVLDRRGAVELGRGVSDLDAVSGADASSVIVPVPPDPSPADSSPSDPSADA